MSTTMPAAPARASAWNSTGPLPSSLRSYPRKNPVRIHSPTTPVATRPTVSASGPKIGSMTAVPTRLATIPSITKVRSRYRAAYRPHWRSRPGSSRTGVSRGSNGWGEAHDRRGPAARPRRSASRCSRSVRGTAVSVTTAFRLVEWGTTPYYAPVCAVRPGWVEMSDFTRTGSPTPCDDLRREPSPGAVETQLGRLEAGQHDRLGRVRGVGHEERQ